MHLRQPRNSSNFSLHLWDVSTEISISSSCVRLGVFQNALSGTILIQGQQGVSSTEISLGKSLSSLSWMVWRFQHKLSSTMFPTSCYLPGLSKPTKPTYFQPDSFLPQQDFELGLGKRKPPGESLFYPEGIIISRDDLSFEVQFLCTWLESKNEARC